MNPFHTAQKNVAQSKSRKSSKPSVWKKFREDQPPPNARLPQPRRPRVPQKGKKKHSAREHLTRPSRQEPVSAPSELAPTKTSDYEGVHGYAHTRPTPIHEGRR